MPTVNSQSLFPATGGTSSTQVAAATKPVSSAPSTYSGTAAKTSATPKSAASDLSNGVFSPGLTAALSGTSPGGTASTAKSTSSATTTYSYNPATGTWTAPSSTPAGQVIATNTAMPGSSYTVAISGSTPGSIAGYQLMGTSSSGVPVTLGTVQSSPAAAYQAAATGAPAAAPPVTITLKTPSGTLTGDAALTYAQTKGLTPDILAANPGIVDQLSAYANQVQGGAMYSFNIPSGPNNAALTNAEFTWTPGGLSIMPNYEGYKTLQVAPGAYNPATGTWTEEPTSYMQSTSPQDTSPYTQEGYYLINGQLQYADSAFANAQYQNGAKVGYVSQSFDPAAVAKLNSLPAGGFYISTGTGTPASSGTSAGQGLTMQEGIKAAEYGAAIGNYNYQNANPISQSDILDFAYTVYKDSFGNPFPSHGLTTPMNTPYGNINPGINIQFDLTPKGVKEGTAPVDYNTFINDSIITPSPTNPNEFVITTTTPAGTSTSNIGIPPQYPRSSVGGNLNNALLSLTSSGVPADQLQTALNNLTPTDIASINSGQGYTVYYKDAQGNIGTVQQGNFTPSAEIEPYARASFLSTLPLADQIEIYAGQHAPEITAALPGLLSGSLAYATASALAASPTARRYGAQTLSMAENLETRGGNLAKGKLNYAINNPIGAAEYVSSIPGQLAGGAYDAAANQVKLALDAITAAGAPNRNEQNLANAYSAYARQLGSQGTSQTRQNPRMPSNLQSHYSGPEETAQATPPNIAGANTTSYNQSGNNALSQIFNTMGNKGRSQENIQAALQYLNQAGKPTTTTQTMLSRQLNGPAQQYNLTQRWN